LFTFLNIISFSQSNNPFSAKKKKLYQKGVVQPSPLSKQSYQVTGNFCNGYFNLKTTNFKTPVFKSNIKYNDIKYDKNGLVSYISYENNLGTEYNSKSDESKIQAAYSFMKRIKTAMRINSPENEFSTIKIWNDKLGFDHIKMQQYFKDIKVYGGQVILHGKNGFLSKLNGTYLPTPNLTDTKPAITSKEAVVIVKNDISIKTHYLKSNLQKDNIFYYKESESELIIYHHKLKNNNEKLAWHITFRPNLLERWEYFVDAKTGEIINKYNNTCSDGPATANATDLNGVTRTINTYKSGSLYYMIDVSKPMYNASQSDMPDSPKGAIWTIDANNSSNGNVSQITSYNNTWSDASAVSAHYNAGKTYNYYLNTHQRNSIDGNGGTIISIVNVVNDNGSSLANAYWNGQAMFYGNGGNIFYPLAGAEDVGAHEMTHGVIQNTANLEYQYESGAINEAMADIGGAMVDRSNWTIGEKIIPDNSPYFPTGALRDMSNPHNGGSSFNDPSYQPMHVNEKYTGENDNGGVHINSGIINYAYYKIGEAISKNKAEKLFYRALSVYMTKSSQFIDCRLAFENAAKDIYGGNSTELQAVSNAFYQVGIGNSGTGGGGSGSNGPGELDINPGQDYVLFYDINNNDPTTIYRTNTEASNFDAVSETKLKRKPSIVDNGSWGIMVSENNEMRAITLSGNFDENVISNEYIWDNVAISKDGKRIAAITVYVDSAIWVYDYNAGEWAKFHLYNPTFTEGITVDNVLYADALEWDYTGQYIIYDAYNEMVNNDGENIDFWDVSVIRVWNNANNNWGNGKIEKVFTSLPEGVSIGNPSLSKNSPYIIAFDYFDANNDVYAVLGANIETGDLSVIYENNTLGFPNYSKKDNFLVFGTEYQGDEVVAVTEMQNDKINPTGDVYLFIDQAKWPVWYSTGNRDLTDVKEKNISYFFSNVYPNPVNDYINIVFEASKQKHYEISLFNITGKKLLTEKGISVKGTNRLILPVVNVKKGIYIININFDNKTKKHKIVKL
jgi:Zn-dependent metalloprotease